MAATIESYYAKFYTNQAVPEVIFTGTATGLVAGCTIKATLTYDGGSRTIPDTQLAFTVLHGSGATNYASFSADFQFRGFEGAVAEIDIVSQTDAFAIEIENEEFFVGAQISITITNDHTPIPIPVLTDPSGN